LFWDILVKKAWQDPKLFKPELGSSGLNFKNEKEEAKGLNQVSIHYRIFFAAFKDLLDLHYFVRDMNCPQATVLRAGFWD
jgi:hypothetical protein